MAMTSPEIKKAREQLGKLSQLMKKHEPEELSDPTAHAVVGLKAKVFKTLYYELHCRLMACEIDNQTPK
jgi:hypothetical protein